MSRRRTPILKSLLYAAGSLNLLFGLFHIWLGYGFHRSPTIPAVYRGLLQAFNAGGALMIFFLAYACLLRHREMLETGLGKAVLVLGSALYLSRALEEFFWFAFSPVIFGSCLVTGAIHLTVLFRSGARRIPQGVPEPGAPD